MRSIKMKLNKWLILLVCLSSCHHSSRQQKSRMLSRLGKRIFLPSLMRNNTHPQCFRSKRYHAEIPRDKPTDPNCLYFPLVLNTVFFGSCAVYMLYSHNAHPPQSMRTDDTIPSEVTSSSRKEEHTVSSTPQSKSFSQIFKKFFYTDDDRDWPNGPC